MCLINEYCIQICPLLQGFYVFFAVSITTPILRIYVRLLAILRGIIGVISG